MMGSKTETESQIVRAKTLDWIYSTCWLPAGTFLIQMYLDRARFQSCRWTPRRPGRRSASCPAPCRPSGRRCSSDSHSPRSGQTCLQYRWRSRPRWDRCTNDHDGYKAWVSQKTKKPRILFLLEHGEAPAQVGEQRVVISWVEAAVSDDHHGHVGFGPATVPDQVVVGILEGRWSPGSASNPLHLLHSILENEEELRHEKKLLMVIEEVCVDLRRQVMCVLCDKPWMPRANRFWGHQVGWPGMFRCDCTVQLRLLCLGNQTTAFYTEWETFSNTLQLKTKLLSLHSHIQLKIPRSHIHGIYLNLTEGLWREIQACWWCWWQSSSPEWSWSVPLTPSYQWRTRCPGLRNVSRSL